MTSLAHLVNSPEKPPQLDDFCRICLLRKVQLRPLATQFSGVMIPEMLYKVTGTLLNMQDLLPRVICDRCLVKLDLAYAISEEFRKQDEKLRRFWWKGGVLVDDLMEYARTEESWRKTHSEEVLDRLASGRLDPVPVAFEVQREEQIQAGVSGTETVETTVLPVKEQIKSEVDEYCIEILSDDSAGEAVEESTQQNIINNEVEMTLRRVLPAESQEDLLVEQDFPDQQQPEVNTFDADAPQSPVESESDQDDDNDKDSDYIPEGIDDIASGLGQIEAEDDSESSVTTDVPTLEQGRMNNLECKYCGKRFVFASCLRLHEATQHAQCGTKRKRAPIKRKGKHFQCELCPRNIWRSKGDFLRHVKSHGEQNKKAEGRYNCHKCGRTYGEKDRLEKHLKRHKVEESGIYRCRNCGKAFAENYVLRRHVSKCESKTDLRKNPPPITIVREGKSYFKCRECAKVFVSRYQHNQHAQTHAGMPKSESHQCPDCGKRFGQRANLRLHQQEVHHSFVVKAEPVDEGGQDYEVHLQGQQRNEAAEVTSGGGPTEELITHASDQPSDLPIIKEVTSSYVKCEEALIEQSPVVQENLSIDESKLEVTDSMDPDQPEPGLAFVHVDNVTIPPLVNIPEWQDQASAADSDYANAQFTDEQESLEATGFSIEILSDDSDDDEVVELSEDEELEASSRPSTSCSESATSVEAPLTKSWTCNLCSIVMSGTTKASITKHMIMHQNILNGKYECEVCQKKFGFDTELQQHRRLIHNMKQPAPKDVVECEKCGKEITRNKFTFHLKCHKNLDARNFVCEVCDKAFGMKRKLQWHQQTKTCQKAHQKQQQQQKRPPSATLPVLVQNRNTLQTPEQRQQDARYKCTECNKSYANSQTIQKHMQQHQAIREGRFKCGICELACPTAWHLETHLRIHPESTQQGDNLATK